MMLSMTLLGQVNDDELNVVREMLDTNKVLHPITYGRKIEGIDETNRLLRALSKGKFYIIENQQEDSVFGEIKGGERTDSLILTTGEIDTLTTNLKKPFSWEENLIPNSISVKDGIEAVEQLEARRKSEDGMKREYFYIFTKPIFLRDNQICFVSIAAVCGRACGYSESAFYKKRNSKWERWIIISSGVY